MPVRILDLAEQSADWAAVVPTWQGAYAHVLPQLPLSRGSKVRLRPDAPDGRRTVLGAFEPDGGAVSVGLAVIDEATAKATTFWVTPALRRQGIGSALLTESLRFAKSIGHPKLLVRMPDLADSAAFARKRAGKLIGRQIMSGLDLDTIDRRALEQWARPGTGYALARWSDHCPDELAASFCAAKAAMADAPDGAHATPLTVGVLREKEQSLVRLGIHRHVQAAIAEDGEVAGFTDIVIIDDEAQIAEVWNTAVVRAHRGSGLSLRLKAAATLWVLGEYPRLRWIGTFNHETNAPMLGVNRSLGYRPLVDWLTFEFDVTG